MLECGDTHDTHTARMCTHARECVYARVGQHQDGILGTRRPKTRVDRGPRRVRELHRGSWDAALPQMDVLVALAVFALLPHPSPAPRLIV
jgi:hypothetical protein